MILKFEPSDNEVLGMVSLTEELILKKTRAKSLDTVKNLNLWGSDLTDVSILEVDAPQYIVTQLGIPD